MNGVKRRWALALISFSLAVLFPTLPAFAQDQPGPWTTALERVPEAQRDSVAQALDLAGNNSPALANVLLSAPDLWLPGAIFLIANMPIEDLTVVTESEFTDTLRLAYEARAEFPWASRVSEDDFLRYVLPMRVSQEPLENFRQYFLDNLFPRY